MLAFLPSWYTRFDLIAVTMQFAHGFSMFNASRFPVVPISSWVWPVAAGSVHGPYRMVLVSVAATCCSLLFAALATGMPATAVPATATATATVNVSLPRDTMPSFAGLSSQTVHIRTHDCSDRSVT